MWRTLEYLLLVMVAVICVGCNRSSEQTVRPTPTPTPQVVAQVVAAQAGVQSSILATPTPQQVESSPIQLPTITPAPLVATATLLPYPKRYRTDGTRIEVTPIPAAAQLTCIPQGEVTTCYDELLDMDFSYPAFMGEILYTMLRKGGYSGYAYAYAFEDQESSAGGRSRDFGEGRGPMYTDGKGFNEDSAENICAGWVAAICQELGPGALLIGILPQAEWLCGDAMMFTAIPRGILVLDLPQHPLINGFSFSFPLMSAEEAEAFEEEWYNNAMQCEPETKVALGTAMEQLSQALPAGTADPEIQQRYDAMIQIAKSIQSPYIVPTP